MKVVLDTNVIISGIFWKGAPCEILKLVESKVDIEFVQSIETFDETERVAKRGKFAEISKRRDLNINIVLESLLTTCNFYHISQVTKDEAKKEVSIEDADDLKFLELAIEAEADYIVSGDPHLLSIKKHKNIRIINPAEFLKIISPAR